ncbi:MAG: helix-turn-helix transcriptional regulator [Bacteroides sp.]|nr:helix-turn-helix transcriptional regulator [Bacteroides sp.]
MEDTLASRLKTYIDTLGYTSVQFADICKIPPASLSQILSGRNKKVSDKTISLIHDAFPDLSIMWLMFGEGPVVIEGNDNPINSSPILGSKNQEIQAVVQPGANNPILEGLNPAPNYDNSPKYQGFENEMRIMDLQNQIEQMRRNPRKVIQITIYYDDSTFETFIPKS